MPKMFFFLAPDLASFRAELMVHRWRDSLAELAERFPEVALESERSLQRVLPQRCRAEQTGPREAALWETLQRRSPRWGAGRSEEAAMAIRSAMMCSVPEES